MFKKLAKAIFGAETPLPYGWTQAQYDAFVKAFPAFGPPGAPTSAAGRKRPAPPPPSAQRRKQAAAPRIDTSGLNLNTLAAAAQHAPALLQTATQDVSTISNIMSSLASTSPTASADASMGGEMTIRHDPDGSVRITHQPHGDIGCEGDVDFEDWSAPSQVEYHESRIDAFGPTHYPYGFGGEFGDRRFHTEGMPTGPVGTGPGSFGWDCSYPGWAPSVPGGYPDGDFDNSDKMGADAFGFDDEFYDGFGPAMIFAGDDVGCDYGVKG